MTSELAPLAVYRSPNWLIPVERSLTVPWAVSPSRQKVVLSASLLTAVPRRSYGEIQWRVVAPRVHSIHILPARKLLRGYPALCDGDAITLDTREEGAYRDIISHI